MASTNDGEMLKRLTQIVDTIANQARQNAPTNRIKQNIKTNSAQVTSEGYEASIEIDISEDGAPEAPAYEWGSGIHSTRGPRQTYEIAPRNKNALAISLDRWPNFNDPVVPGPKMIGEGNKGLLLRKVDHPGVEARPYMTPAIVSNLENIQKELNVAVRSTLISGKRVEVVA